MIYLNYKQNKRCKLKTRKFRTKQINIRLTEEVKQALDIFLVETQQTAADFFEKVVIEETAKHNIKNKKGGK